MKASRTVGQILRCSTGNHGFIRPGWSEAMKRLSRGFSRGTSVLTMTAVCCFVTFGFYSEAAPASKNLPGEITNTIGMKFVLIPAGEFMMGSSQSVEEVVSNGGGEVEYYRGEQPRHRVSITRPFYLGVHEVTQKQYEAIMGENPSYFEGENNPVDSVSWFDAVEFCKKLTEKEGITYRLPTEAEWEYSCRAGTETPFHYGNSLSSRQANFHGEYPYGKAEKGPFRAETLPVGSFKPNAWGLYDMHGNMYEWCADWYDVDYYGESTVDDPQGPASGEYRVRRSGAWINTGAFCRSVYRSWLGPENICFLCGFRCVRVVPE